MDGYAAIPEAKEKKRLGCRSWPAILSTVIGCVLCVIVGIAIFVGLIAVVVILAGQSALQTYSPGETRLANTPALFFCKSVSLDVLTNKDYPNTDFEVTVYLVGFTPPTSPIRRPLTLSVHNHTQVRHGFRFLTYLQPRSTIVVTACAHNSPYSLYIFMSLTNLNSFHIDPATADTYSLIPRRLISTPCSEGNDHVYFNVSVPELYVIGLVSDVLPFYYNATTVFNRTELSLANGTYTNCSSSTISPPCKVPVPLSVTSNLLVDVAVPSNWNNISNAPVTLTCESRPESFVIISVVPLLAVLLPVCLFGIFGSFCKCSCKSKKVKVQAINENDPIVPLIRDDIRPYAPEDSV